ncbi:MAG: octanoyltransferase [Blastocatellia bacterium]
MSQRNLIVRCLGLIGYREALRLQKSIETDVIARLAADHLLLLEHPHTFTVGRRAGDGRVLASSEILRNIGAEVFETDRGGKVTYHGPGQIVGYPVINLSPDREDVHRYVRDLEEALIRALGDFGIEAFRIEGLTGVHTAEGKIAAIGIHIKRWVTTHGFALNVNTDLTYFNWIVACEGEPVTSMERLIGNEVSIDEVKRRMIAHFAEVFGYRALQIVEDSCPEAVEKLGR